MKRMRWCSNGEWTEGDVRECPTCGGDSTRATHRYNYDVAGFECWEEQLARLDS